MTTRATLSDLLLVAGELKDATEETLLRRRMVYVSILERTRPAVLTLAGAEGARDLDGVIAEVRRTPMALLLFTRAGYVRRLATIAQQIHTSPTTL